MKARSIIAWILFVAVGLLYVLAGVGKFSESGPGMFAEWGLPTWLAPIIGVLEIAGGLGLMVPRITRWAVYGLSVIMIGAFLTHIANAEFTSVIRPLIFSGAFWLAFYLRPKIETVSSN